MRPTATTGSPPRPSPAPGSPGRWLRPSLLLAGSLVLGGGLSYLYHIALGRLLGPGVYGAFAALLGLFYLLWIFNHSVQLGFARLSAGGAHPPPRTLVAVGAIGLGIALGMGAASGPLASWLRLTSRDAVILVGIVWLLTLPLPAAKGLLQGHQRFALLALLNFVEPLARLLLGVALVGGGTGLYGAWGAWGLAALLVLPLALLPPRRAAKRAQGIDGVGPASPTPDRDLGWAWLAAAVLAVPTNVDVLVAQHAFPAEIAGRYAAVAVLGKGFLFVALSVGAVLLPRVAGGEPSEQRGRPLRTALALGIGLNAGGALVLSLAPEFALKTLFGEAYAGAGAWLRLYAGAMLAFTGAALLLTDGLARGDRVLVGTLALLSGGEVLWLLGGPPPRDPEALVTTVLTAQILLLAAAAGVRGMGCRSDASLPEDGSRGGIALVAPYPPPGRRHVAESGVASYTHNLVDALEPRLPLPLTVLAPAPSSARWERTAAAGAPDAASKVRRCWHPGWGFPWHIARAVRELRPSLVHLQHEPFLFGQGASAALFPGLLLWLRIRRVRVVVTLHGVPPLRRLDRAFLRENGLRGHPAWMRFGLRWLLRTTVLLAHRTVVHEDRFRDRLIREYGCPAARIAVIPHGIEELSEEERRRLPTPAVARKRLGVPVDGQVVLYLGYLTGYKGVEVLLEGFARAAAAHPPRILLLGGGPHPRRRGDPDYEAFLRRLAAQAEALGTRVRRLGFVPEERLGEVFRAAEVAIFPYRAVLASSGPMALCVKFGCPFLASRAFRGILPEELLFPLTPEGIAEALEEFFSSATESKGMCARARALLRTWAAERSWERVAERTWALYRELLPEVPPSPGTERPGGPS